MIRRIVAAANARPAAAKLVANISWLVVERVLLMVVGLGVNVWFVRYVGPEQFGEYSYALSFVGLFTAFVALGMDAVVVRELTRSPESESEILGTAVALRAAAGSVAWAAAVGTIIWMRAPPQTRTLVAITAGSSLFVGLAGFELWFQAKQAGRALVMSRMGVLLASYAVRIALIEANAPLEAFAVLFLATSGATAAALFVGWRRLTERRSPLRWSQAFARALWRDSWPLIAMTVSIAIYMKIDQVMLTAMRGEAENGIYAVAVTFSELWYFLPLAVATSVYPMLVAARERGAPGEYAVATQRFYDGIIGVGYAVAVPLCLAAGPLIQVLFGPQYGGSVTPFRVHIASLPFVCVGVARGRYLVTEGMTGFAVWATVAGAIANVSGNLILIPRWGATGAAWSTLLSYALANFISGFAYRPIRAQSMLLGKALLGPVRALRGLAGHHREHVGMP